MLGARLEGDEGIPQARRAVRGVVAIDGPAGSGKSTAAHGLGRELAVPVLSTGVYFRLAAYLACEQGFELPQIVETFGSVSVTVDGDAVIVASRRLRDELRTPEVAAVASKVAAEPSVRDAVLALERAEIVRHRAIVVEGRDIGSVVWPQAEWKFFVTARRSVREQRRPEEAPGIAARDTRDATRAVAPLAIARGAFLMDTSDLTPEEVVTRMLRVVRGAP